jgi:hypothetical protein
MRGATDSVASSRPTPRGTSCSCPSASVSALPPSCDLAHRSCYDWPSLSLSSEPSHVDSTSCGRPPGRGTASQGRSCTQDAQGRQKGREGCSPGRPEGRQRRALVGGRTSVRLGNVLVQSSRARGRRDGVQAAATVGQWRRSPAAHPRCCPECTGSLAQAAAAAAAAGGVGGGSSDGSSVRSDAPPSRRQHSGLEARVQHGRRQRPPGHHSARPPA